MVPRPIRKFSKVDRRRQVLAELIQARPFKSQEELANALKALGYRVDRATISRDLQAIGIGKRLQEGRSRYFISR